MTVIHQSFHPIETLWHSYCSVFNLKNFCYHSTGCCVHNISLLGFVWSNKIILILQALSVVPTYNIVHSMWRISSVFSLRNLQHTVKRSNLNTVRLYHAEKGCFGYRPSLQVTDRGKHTSHLCTCRNYKESGHNSRIHKNVPGSN